MSTIIDFLGGIWEKTKNGIFKVESFDFENKMNAKELAEEASIALISKTLARAEFITYDKGQSVNNTKNYYVLNVESNDNESSNYFWENVIRTLLRESEALVIIENENHYLADPGYQVIEKPFEANLYKDIYIGGNKILKTYEENQVFRFKLPRDRKKAALNGLSEDYTRLIKSAMKTFLKKSTTKTKMNIPTNYPKTEEAQSELQDLLEDQMKEFLNPEKDSVFPETNGITLSEFGGETKGKSYESDKTIKTLIFDVFDLVAIANTIPPSLLKGDTVDTKDAMNNFLVFCIIPLAKLISDEINRKMYGFENYKENTYMKVDTSQLKVTDLKDIGNAIDMISRNGGYTIDDILKVLGKEPIGGDEGGLRFITKNYATVDSILYQDVLNKKKKGGE